MKALLIFFIFLIILIDWFLFLKIKRRINILGINQQKKIYYLDNNNTISTTSSKLKYYFEPGPNNVEHSPSYLNWVSAEYTNYHLSGGIASPPIEIKSTKC